jgi:hypothetical protein
MASQSSFAQRWRDYRPSKKMFAGGCAASFAATVAVGFVWGGWVTGGRADMLYAMAADQARADLAATVCVNRFLAAPDAAARRDALRKQQPWYRSEVLEDAGWTVLSGMQNLPGSQEPVAGTADLCARRLMAITAPSNHTSDPAKASPS